MPNLSETKPVAEVSPQAQETRPRSIRLWQTSFWQIARFSTVGVLNTLIDVVTLNILLWRFPTHNANLLLVYNSCAYFLGALNSLFLNKYWTFKHTNALSGGEVARFAVLSVACFFCNDSILWLAARLLHPLIVSNLLWANTSKGIAIAGTLTVSYLGMRLWVFSKKKGQDRRKQSQGTV